MTEPEIENALRKAPKVTPPPGLLQTLERDVRLTAQAKPMAPPWWRRWAPALSFGMLIAGGIVVLAVQHVQLRDLRLQTESLQQSVEHQRKAASSAGPTLVQAQDDAAARRAEAESLRSEIERLKAETAELDLVKQQQQQLRSQLASAKAAAVSEDPFAAQKAKAHRVACINNIKQICLALRMWANDHGEVFPPALTSLQKELPSPKLLTCPADEANLPAATTWEQVNPAQISYEWLAPNAPEGPYDRVIIRCRIHPNAGLADGSAHQLRDASMYVVEDGIVKIRPVSYE